jgi:hypothetical protein
VAATVLIANTATAASQLLAAWVFTAEAAAAAALIADDADGGDRGVAVVGGAFEDADAMAGASGAGTPRMGGDSGDYADPAGAILDDGFIRSLIFNQTDSLLSHMKATTLSQIQNPQ